MVKAMGPDATRSETNKGHKQTLARVILKKKSLPIVNHKHF